MHTLAPTSTPETTTASSTTANIWDELDFLCDFVECSLCGKVHEAITLECGNQYPDAR